MHHRKTRNNYKATKAALTFGAMRFSFAIICLLAFFARFSVVLGHDCEKVNIFSSINEKTSLADEHQHAGHVSEKAATISGLDCHSVAQSEKHHDHETCPVCIKYEELQKDSFFSHYFSIAIFPQNILISVISIPESVVFREKKYTPLPRAPPLV